MRSGDTATLADQARGNEGSRRGRGRTQAISRVLSPSVIPQPAPAGRCGRKTNDRSSRSPRPSQPRARTGSPADQRADPHDAPSKDPREEGDRHAGRPSPGEQADAQEPAVFCFARSGALALGKSLPAAQIMCRGTSHPPHVTCGHLGARRRAASEHPTCDRRKLRSVE